MARPKKNAAKVEVQKEPVVVVPEKVRKSYPSVDERIAMADAKIAQLSKLNASREALVEKTAALLAERQDTLAKSKAQQEKVERRRERLIASKEKPAKQPRARKNVAAEDPQMMELMALLASKNMTMEEIESGISRRIASRLAAARSSRSRRRIIGPGERHDPPHQPFRCVAGQGRVSL